MSTLNKLMQKRARLEQQIADAQRREKRKAEIVALFEKHGLLDLSDDEILNALLPKPEQPAPMSPTLNTYTGSAS
jgi:hypothetical protein